MAIGFPNSIRNILFSSGATNSILVLTRRRSFQSSSRVFHRIHLSSTRISANTFRTTSTTTPHMSNKSMSDIAKDNVIAAIQLTSTHDKERNFLSAVKWIDEAVKNNAKVVCLPEGFDYIGRNKNEISALAETLDGDLMKRYKNKAKEHGVWLLLGGFHELQARDEDDAGPRISNSHVAINPAGEIFSVYRKIHLFDVDIPEHKIYLKESAYVRAGEEILSPVTTPVGRVGLGICYDLRFPEFSWELRRRGSDILTYPSAFTVVTGRAHWETLLRARAIETQCFVVAAAQTGRHNETRESYGHSMIVNGWGEVLAEATTNEEQVIYASVDLAELHQKRLTMPVAAHRRYDLYGNTAASFSIPDESLSDSDFPFGKVNIKGKFIFLKSRLSYATVNKRCVVPGHVLVISDARRVRLTDLSQSEMADLFMLAKQVVKIVDEMNQTSSATVAVQDGPEAGQSINHVHVHVLPRRSGDFQQNDDIYNRLQSHDKGEVVWREEKDMEEETLKLREHIRKFHSHILL